MGKRLKSVTLLMTIITSLYAEANKDVLGQLGPFTTKQFSTQSLELLDCSAEVRDLGFYVKQIGSSRINLRQYVVMRDLTLEYSNGDKESLNVKSLGRTHVFSVDIDPYLGCPSRVVMTARNARFVNGKMNSVFIQVKQMKAKDI